MDLRWNCPNCGGVFPYHNLPCNGGVSSPPLYQFPYAPPKQDEEGCRPLKQLTEDDVRRIVREELAAMSREAQISND